MADQPHVITDLAKPILESDPALSDEHRADLWDAFHGAKNPGELAQQLQPLGIHDDTKQRLLDAKTQSMPPTGGPLDKVSAVMHHLSQIDPEVLEMAETHPNVLKALTAAFAGAEKGSGEPAGASKGGSKADTASEAKKPTPPAADMPATPSGHALVHGSDGGLHHIPHANLDKARGIDPQLQILHVEP